MPHQCTDCGRSFADGSTEMLSGCPDCGGNTFQYRPDDAGGEAGDETPPEPPVESSVARRVGSAATAVRDLVGSNSTPANGPEEPVSGPEPTTGGPSTGSDGETAGGSFASTESDGTTSEVPQEDAAQASARSEVVAPDELPVGSVTETTDRPTPVLDGTAEASLEDEGEESPERPDLETLREELNDQFESIRVVEPGQYELNLMELYDREEYIIALQEDGKYTIQVPEHWKGE